MVHCVVAASFLRNMHIAIESIASNNIICSTWREEGENVAGGLTMHNLLSLKSVFLRFKKYLIHSIT
jgi:hypothetical protein